MFSGRVDWELEDNELTRALARERDAGRDVSDLTSSNPTRCGIDYPGAEILDAIAPEAALVYDPDPRGLRVAREAVSDYYRSLGEPVGPDELILTASTSEAYGYIFKLLAGPGDDVLVPRPSYPLFDFLATLEAVRPVAYPLYYDGAWHVDFGALEASLTPRSRAILAVHPNNPTGAYVSDEDRERLLELGERRGVAVIVDEVFLDYPLGRASACASFASAGRGLVLVLSGLSKLAGLPQMKLGWIAVRGASSLASEALMRLEHVADLYLSVGAAVQHAAPRLLELGVEVRRRISERTSSNLAGLASWIASEPAATLLQPAGGWYATLRLPAIQTSEAWALDLLESASVHVHPGSLFGFAGEAYVVVSLLTPPVVLETGITRALEIVSARMSAHG